MATQDMFATLGHDCAGWLVKDHSSIAKAAAKNRTGAQLRNMFHSFLSTIPNEPAANAHLIALTLRSNQTVYTGVQSSVWNQLDSKVVYVGAFELQNGQAILKRWQRFDSGFASKFNNTDPDNYKKTTAKDGKRILITLQTNNGWKEVP